jgi:hypothetical protein
LKPWHRGSCKTTIYFSALLPFAFSLRGSEAVSVSAYLLLALSPTKQAMVVCVTIRSRKERFFSCNLSLL